MSGIQTPVYVKIDEFKEVLSILNNIKSKLNEANNTLKDVETLKNKEDVEFENWKQSLAEVTDKIVSLDNVLFEQEG